MTGSATQVQESSLSEDDDSVTIWEEISINLRFNFSSLDTWVSIETSHVDFVIEMSDVSDNSVVLHLGH